MSETITRRNNSKAEALEIRLIEQIVNSELYHRLFRYNFTVGVLDEEILINLGGLFSIDVSFEDSIDKVIPDYAIRNKRAWYRKKILAHLAGIGFRIDYKKVRMLGVDINKLSYYLNPES